MSSGKVHISYWRKLSVIIPPFSIIFGGIIYYLFPDRPLWWALGALGLCSGYLLGYLIDPDLDEIGATSGEGRMMGVLKIFGAILMGYFVPYAYLNRFMGLPKGKKGHRNFFSHAPFVGTLIRLAYLFLPLLIYVGFFEDIYYEEIIFAICLWIGLGIADTIHMMLDWFPQKNEWK